MNMQLHSCAPNELISESFTFDLTPRMGMNKPEKAFWTSTYTPDSEHLSAWLEWCASEGFGEWETHYLIQPNADVRVLTIDSHKALAQLPRSKEGLLSRLNIPHIDFKLLSQDYDAIHLPLEAVNAVHLPMMHERWNGDMISLYGWDCESTCWLRHAFTIVGQVPS
jgi:hypothetical protein